MPIPRRHLLLVEDDADQCRVLQDRLQLYGYTVDYVQDGRTAMDSLGSGSFDGLVLDLNLPILNGHEVLAQARQKFPNLPVLIISASQSRIRAAKASQAKACGYLLKPFNVTDFKSALHGCFGPTT
jgi:two-component system, OmpR family, response regulator QseB